MELSIKWDAELERALERALTEIPANVHRKVLGQASRRVMRPLVTTARKYVPRRTGLLRKSLGTAQKKYGHSGTIYTIVGPRTGFKSQVGTRRDGSPIWANPHKYAHLVEYGSKRSKPARFLRKAFDAHRSSIVSALGSALAAGISREAAKHPPRGRR